MSEYIPTAIQREAYGADHSSYDVKRSIVFMMSTGKGVDRVRVNHYVSHDVDATGENDTVGIYAIEVRAAGETVRGYAEVAFNLFDGVPVAADFRSFHPVVKSV